MDYEIVKQYRLNKPEAREDYPSGPNALVFKVRNKLFGILGEKNGLGALTTTV
jgi:predicted DNA-binding protein (MmcQ/YjbR family)